jgi:hypothetical protein
MMSKAGGGGADGPTHSQVRSPFGAPVGVAQRPFAALPGKVHAAPAEVHPTVEFPAQD